MTAAILTGHSGLDKLEIHQDWPVPQPKASAVLIKVAACGINNTDINTRIGWYDDSVAGDTNAGGTSGFDSVSDDSVGSWGSSTISFPRIQGADTVGHVVELGEGVDDDWLNARVMSDNWLRDWSQPMNRDKTGYIGSECDGGFAEYVVLPITNLGRISSEWSDAELATLSCSYTTAENMLGRARVSADDTVLVTGASGGVGSALIQLAKRRGATVIALTNQAKASQVKAIGPDAVIRRGQDDWGQVIRSVTDSDKVSVAADVVGGPVFDQLMTVLAKGGRYVTSGAIGGKRVELDISHLYLNDWELIGSTITETNVFPDLLHYVENNEIRPLLAETYPLTDIHQAQADFLEKQHVGKLVLIP
ncbi:alcohol dehydrogenase family protein [Chloroflexi bacterium TSY]|nr:alcohol dehydrogenase family protein [Chloroflexi bacterium TSY]